MGDKRTDSGQYYPGGKVVSQHGVAPPQIIVQWSDVQGKPQIAPLPDRYKDSDVKGKINEIASKLATALAVALVGWTAFAGLVVQKAPKEDVWNDEDIVTNAYLTGENASGSVRTLPKYLWIADLDDSYPEDAAWYYRQPQDYGHCSSVRDGNTYSRNLDWKFNSMAEVIIRMSARQGRFASLGVANVGTNLTEEIVASGAPTRYVKALPGHTVDGINENGVVCSVNVVDGQITGWNGCDIHPLGAVRWVLDHATSALDAATNLAARISFPQGWSQNFHWMVADADTTYIVENGEYRPMTGRAVMTNFPLINRVDGTGLERYNLLMSQTANITNAWWTLAYLPATSPRRYSDLETTDESVIRQIFDAWAGDREIHRGQTFGNKTWWQTVHTTVYDISNRIMRISVQEIDDWYVFALSSGGKVKSVNGQTGDVVIDIPAVPAKWALTNVTNANGGAVSAADVGAATTGYADRAATAAVEAFYNEEYSPHMRTIASSLNSRLFAADDEDEHVGRHFVMFNGAGNGTADSGWGADDFYQKGTTLNFTTPLWVKGSTSKITLGRTSTSRDPVYSVLSNGALKFRGENGEEFTITRDGIKVWPWWDEDAEDDMTFIFPTNNPAGGTLALREDIPSTAEIERAVDARVSANLNTFVDGETGVEYVGKFYGGSLYYVPTGNVYPPNN